MKFISLVVVLLVGFVGFVADVSEIYSFLEEYNILKPRPNDPGKQNVENPELGGTISIQPESTTQKTPNELYCEKFPDMCPLGPLPSPEPILKDSTQKTPNELYCERFPDMC